MRFKSDAVGGLQVFAVAGTNVVSFGIKADRAALGRPRFRDSALRSRDRAALVG